MSGDLQTRKRKGKGKKKDDLDDDVAEVKNSKAAVNGSHRSQSSGSGGGGGGGGNGSGVVAKVVFLVLLLALTLVVALIVVELRGKRAGMKDATESLMPEAAPVVDPMPEPPAPDIPPLVVEEEELPVPPPPPPVLHEADVEEYEPMEATPPLDEYVRVVQQPQEQVEEIPQPARVVEEVEAPVVVEEVVEVPQVEEPQKAKVVEKLEAPMEVVEEVPVVEEVVEVIVEEIPVVEVVKIVEETPVEEVEEVIEVIEEVVEPKEEPKPVEEGTATPVVEKVVEPAIPESSQDVVTEEAPSQTDEEEEEEVEKTAPSPSQVAEEEEEEDWSQFGKEGSTEMLTDAYLGVESLASEILAKDPQNPMVAQLTPHLAGVVRAMEDGQTEGLLDTLQHIETILQDVKTRLNLNMDKVAGDSQQPPPYEKADITSDIDNSLREELDAADKLLPRNPAQALNSFGAILHHNPKSARAIYGRACSLDQLAEDEHSNSRLEQAILAYRSVLDLADEDPTLVPLPLLRAAAERCIDRMSFRGFLGKALRVQQRLLQRFPDDVDLRNKLGVTYLMMNQGSAAKVVFQTVLQKWPDNGFAQVHYGFVLKTVDDDLSEAVWYLREGIKSQAEGTQDARFFYQLGDALQRQGKNDEAYEVYDQAVEKGLFMNRYQRSLYNVDRLTSRPLWSHSQTTYQLFFRNLEDNWEAIRDEGIALLNLPPQDGFMPEKENLHDKGDWKQYELFRRGRKVTANCIKAPVTCGLIENFAPAAGCKRGQVKFSVMEPGTHVHPHTGPTNCRLRAHLGLVIPPGLRMRVANKTATWEEGKVFVFDDSWEHEVWHEGPSSRLVLIVDVWHPELTDQERKSLPPI